MASMDRWFQRWGSWTIILGRLVPFIPFDAISYLSGLTKVRIERFAFLTFLGSLPRCLLYAYIGELIAEYNLPILIALFVTMLTVFLFFKIKKEKYIVNRFNFFKEQYHDKSDEGRKYS
ncbi:MAG: VTT domain-containing protein [Nitrososphaerota archaeon]